MRFGVRREKWQRVIPSDSGRRWIKTHEEKVFGSDAFHSLGVR